MKRYYTPLILCALTFWTFLFCPLAANAQSSGRESRATKEQQRRAAKIKKKVAERMVNGKRDVVVSLRDGALRSGFIDEPNENGFMLVNLERKSETTMIAYDSVMKITNKREKGELTTGEKTFIVVLGVGAFVTFAALFSDK